MDNVFIHVIAFMSAKNSVLKALLVILELDIVNQTGPIAHDVGILNVVVIVIVIVMKDAR